MRSCSSCWHRVPQAPLAGSAGGCLHPPLPTHAPTHLQLLSHPVPQGREALVHGGVLPDDGGVRVQQAVRHGHTEGGVARVAHVAHQEGDEREQGGGVTPAQGLRGAQAERGGGQPLA